MYRLVPPETISLNIYSNLFIYSCKSIFIG
nr:MAG TPA: hypothetical protein [Bacteriophage sp.]